jgi:cytochrome c oxidase subunit 2
VVSNYGWFLPVQASSYAAEIDKGIWILHIAMFAIFILWGIFFTYLLMKYRARGGSRKAEDIKISVQASLAPDIAVLTFEILLVIFYAVPSWSDIKMNVPEGPDVVHAQVVGEQYNWNIRYPGPDGKFGRTAGKLVDFANPFGIDPADKDGADDVWAVNEMRFPINKKVVVRLSSKDVIHSFFIPSFRIKQDAVPGMNIPIWFEPTRLGDYEVTCAQLCGVGHAMMRADVKVQSDEDFNAWLASLAPKKEVATTEEEW